MFSTNACGTHPVKNGNVVDYVVDADIVLTSGETLTPSKAGNTLVEALPDNFSLASHRDGIKFIRDSFFWKEIIYSIQERDLTLISTHKEVGAILVLSALRNYRNLE